MRCRTRESGGDLLKSWPGEVAVQAIQEGARMAERTDRQDMTTVEEVVLGQALELEALMNVLERKGVLSKAEILEEMKRLRVSAPKAK